MHKLLDIGTSLGHKMKVEMVSINQLSSHGVDHSVMCPLLIYDAILVSASSYLYAKLRSTGECIQDPLSDSLTRAQ